MTLAFASAPVGAILAASALALALLPARNELAHELARERAASRAAVERALPLMQHSATVWSREMACFSCHHQGLGALAVGLARERGFEPDEAAFQAELDAARERSRVRYEPLLVCDGVGIFGRALTLVALGAGGRPRDDVSDALSHFVAARQMVSGAWASNEHRPPIEDSAVSATAWSVRALSAYGPEGRGEEMRGRVTAARGWLAAVEPRDGEEQSLQLLGLAWAGTSDAELAPRAAALAAAQREDGGWAQLPTLASDAYATGQA
ncbi:MAG TPA: hypothetical protein VMT18_11550, partial [Planctomycetota bacterium]|nr:hypothetical protein [Planctomycetota bacterium]